MGRQVGTPSRDAKLGRQVGTPSWDAKLGRTATHSHTITHNHIQSQKIINIHKHSQHSYTNIHNTHNKSQFITQSWDAIIQTHKTSQYSQKITGGSQKITPIYIYIYILIPIEKNSHDDEFKLPMKTTTKATT